MITIQEAPDRGLIRAMAPDKGPAGVRQVGYAIPIELGRYLVRLPDSCAAPYPDRAEAIAALRALDATT